MKVAAEFLRKLNSKIAIIGGIGLVAMMLITVVEVAIRKTIGIGVRGATEYAQFSLCLIIFGALAYTESERGHLQITLILRPMPQKSRFSVLAFMNLANAATAGAITYGILSQAVKYSSAARTTTAMLTNIPYYPFYYICGVCCAFFTLTLLFTMITSICAIWNKEIAEDITSHWS